MILMPTECYCCKTPTQCISFCNYWPTITTPDGFSQVASGVNCNTSFTSTYFQPPTVCKSNIGNVAQNFVKVYWRRFDSIYTAHLTVERQFVSGSFVGSWLCDMQFTCEKTEPPTITCELLFERSYSSPGEGNRIAAKCNYVIPTFLRKKTLGNALCNFYQSETNVFRKFPFFTQTFAPFSISVFPTYVKFGSIDVPLVIFQNVSRGCYTPPCSPDLYFLNDGSCEKEFMENASFSVILNELTSCKNPAP